MPSLFGDDFSDHRANAQANLKGRTHYVDDDTLKFHHSRVIRFGISHDRLIAWLITSEPNNMPGYATRRVFRYSIFDVFGHVVSRDKDYSTAKSAEKAMWSFLNALDAQAHTLEAIESAKRYHAMEMSQLTTVVNSIGQEDAA